MKLSNEKIISIINGSNSILTTQLPVKASYAIAKNIDKIEKEAEIYNAERKKLLEKYSEKNDDGSIKSDEVGNITIAKEHIEKWNEDINTLLKIEVEIDVHMFNLNEIINNNISAAELRLINFMIEE